MFAPILMVQLAKFHKYIGARDMALHDSKILYCILWNLPVAPIGEETLTSCNFKIPRTFFYVCSTITLVQDGYQQQYIGALLRESKC
jgi:hypothetical protein